VKAGGAITQYATWASYGGDARTWLALGLLAAAVAAVLAGLLLPLPVQFTQPGPAGRAALMTAPGGPPPSGRTLRHRDRPG
jgi:hypothetical protein